MPRTEPQGWRLLATPHYAAVLVGLAGGILLQAMNALLMSTVVPSAIADIGGLAFMNWPTTAYLAVSVVAATGASLLRKALGGRMAYAVAASVFAVGALISALAPSIWFLILGRMIQGGGGGLLSALAYMLVRVAFPEALWSRVFALFNSMWGIAVLTGPLIGGVFAGWGLWRGAFFVVAAMAAGLCAAALSLFPRDEPDGEAPAKGFPAGRLTLAAIAIAFLSAAGPVADMVLQAALVGGALALFVALIRLDRKASNRLLPSDAFSFSTATGAGLWVLLLLMAANDPWAIYGPLLLQTLHGLDPLSAGYAVAVESVGWTLVALLIAGVPARWEPVCLVLGPIVMAAGMFGIALSLSAGPLSLVFVPIFLAGAGIGACYTFLAQRVLAGARPGEEAVAGAAVATIQLVGLAIGSALAGMIANAAGLKGEITLTAAETAAFWIPATFAPLALVAGLIAVRLVFVGLRPRALPSPAE